MAIFPPPQPALSWDARRWPKSAVPGFALRLLPRVGGWLLLTWFYTCGNGFPYYYHTDEPSKVAQVLNGERNFYHPQLLLAATEGLLGLQVDQGAARTPQGCVAAGRLASALFGAGAAVLLGILAGWLRGPLGEIGALVLVGGNPLLFELAHYMKEDTAWEFGLAATLLAAAWLEQRRDWTAALVLGAAAGLATSGKYIGLTTSAAAAIFVWLLPRWVTSGPGDLPSRGRLLAPMLLGFVSMFALVNWLVLAHPVQAWAGLLFELRRLRDLSAGSDHVLQWKYVHKLIRFAWPMPLLPAIGFILRLSWMTARPRNTLSGGCNRTAWLGIVFWAGLFAMLLFTPRIKDRYLLPVLVLTAAGAALGIADGAAWVRIRRGTKAGWAAGLAALLLTAAPQWPALAQYWREFHSDDHRDLAAFLRANIPDDALLAHDHHVVLARPSIAATRYLSDLGTLEDFQRWGVRYFIVSREDYGSVLTEPPSRRDPELKARCEALYGRLFTSGKLLWERPYGRVLYLHPGLRVYYLGPEKKMTNDETQNPEIHTKADLESPLSSFVIRHSSFSLNP